MTFAKSVIQKDRQTHTQTDSKYTYTVWERERKKIYHDIHREIDINNNDIDTESNTERIMDERGQDGT